MSARVLLSMLMVRGFALRLSTLGDSHPNLPESPLPGTTKVVQVKLLLGQPPPGKVRFLIGLASVSRPTTYLFRSIESMLKAMSESDRSEVAIIIHLADFDTSWVDKTLKKLQTDYKELFSTGHMQVIHTDKNLYPQLDVCPPKCNFGDAPERVYNRAKQNVDMSALMEYCANLKPKDSTNKGLQGIPPTYYLHMEDDIRYERRYFEEIRNSVDDDPRAQASLNHSKGVVSYSRLGFIGKLMSIATAKGFARELLQRYAEKPCDMILWEYDNGPNYFHFNERILFHHDGIQSTFVDHFQTAEMQDLDNFESRIPSSFMRWTCPEKHQSEGLARPKVRPISLVQEETKNEYDMFVFNSIAPGQVISFTNEVSIGAVFVSVTPESVFLIEVAATQGPCNCGEFSTLPMGKRVNKQNGIEVSHQFYSEFPAEHGNTSSTKRCLRIVGSNLGLREMKLKVTRVPKA